MSFIEIVAAYVNLMVRLLNHPNWTSTTQVMAYLSELPQLRLSLSLCPDFGTSFLC